jgi:hypothetical protein
LVIVNFVYGVIIFIAVTVSFIGMTVVAVGYAFRLDDTLRRGRLYLLRPVGALAALGFLVAYFNLFSQRFGVQPLQLNPFVVPEFAPYQAAFLSYIKWLALACIVILGFVGITGVAVGRATGNLDWSQYGQRGLLLGGLLAVLLGTIYGLLNALFRLT